MITQSIEKYLLIGLGSLALALGLVGVFMPVLPTTPFLLLASFCYIRSSKRMYNWLINHRIFGPYLYNYVTYRAVKRNVKIGGLIFLWLSLAISIFLVENLHIRLFLLAVGCGVSIHLLTLHNLKEEP